MTFPRKLCYENLSVGDTVRPRRRILLMNDMDAGSQTNGSGAVAPPSSSWAHKYRGVSLDVPFLLLRNPFNCK